jgi:hypothetical protein
MCSSVTESWYLVEWLLAFVLTQAVECPIYARVQRPPRRWLKAFGASALTHPLLWFVLPCLWPGGYLAMVVAGETMVVTIEGLYLAALGVRRFWLWSPLANAASLTLGLFIQWLRAGHGG